MQHYSHSSPPASLPQVCRDGRYAELGKTLRLIRPHLIVLTSLVRDWEFSRDERILERESVCGAASSVIAYLLSKHGYVTQIVSRAIEHAIPKNLQMGSGARCMSHDFVRIRHPLAGDTAPWVGVCPSYRQYFNHHCTDLPSFLVFREEQVLPAVARVVDRCLQGTELRRWSLSFDRSEAIEVHAKIWDWREAGTRFSDSPGTVTSHVPSARERIESYLKEHEL